MDDEFAAFAAHVADEAARCSIELHEAHRLLAEILDGPGTVTEAWRHRAEKHLRGDR